MPFRALWTSARPCLRAARLAGACVLLLYFAAPAPAATPQFPENPDDVDVIGEFLGAGLGAPHPQAPAQLADFGRLVGVWRAEQEFRRQDGTWEQGSPAYWVWKYAAGGFAIHDLWYQSAAALPRYMAQLGRDYLLSAVRTYDVNAGGWRVAWYANAAGQTPGADFGTFEARNVDGAVVMRSPADDGMPQRISFHSIEADSFRWVSEFSRDGGVTWDAVMRVTAARVR